MDTATRHYPLGDLRVSDADRDRALCELSEAFQAGRITADELDQRSGQALGARTGKELTALLADLPADHASADAAVEQAHRVLASRVVACVSGAAATSLAAVAVTNGLSGSGPDLQKREAARDVLASLGLKIPLPPAPGFDWAGTVTPAVIAVLLIAMTIVVLRAAHAERKPPTRDMIVDDPPGPVSTPATARPQRAN